MRCQHATAERPILVHCRNGADRSGLVFAFYVAAIAHGSEWFAELQLTPLFGHIPFFLLQSYAMDRSYERAGGPSWASELVEAGMDPMSRVSQVSHYEVKPALGTLAGTH